MVIDYLICNVYKFTSTDKIRKKKVAHSCKVNIIRVGEEIREVKRREDEKRS